MHAINLKFCLAAGLSAIALGSAAEATPAIDVVQAPTAYFLPGGTNWSDPPYYRSASEDWGWTHNPVLTPFTTATLNIGAYDVDSCCGELDTVYAMDDGVWTLLGSLTGINDTYSYSTFVLTSNFFDDIAAGLQTRVDIDSLDTGLWSLTLTKSVLSLDDGVLPPVTPGVPEPATWAMMLLGFGFIGTALRRRSRQGGLALA